VLECPSHRAIQRYGTFFLRNARNCVDFVERDFLRDPGGREEIRSRFPHSGSSASARRPRFQPRARGLEQLATETNVVVSESARAVVSVALPIGRFSCPPESRWFAEPRPRHGEFCSVGSPICASRAIKHKSFHWMRESGPISYQELPSIRTPSEEICSSFTVPTVRPDPEGTLLAVTMRIVTPLTASWER
jgi:hypothetical protein